MKTFVGVLLVAACLVACAHSFPGGRDTDNDERKNLDTVLVLPSDTRDRFIRQMPFGIPDLSLDDSDENPTWSWPGMFRTSHFDDWYASMQAFMKRLSDQMAGILSDLPEDGIGLAGKIPEGANTTSTTKIIDGHVVTMNETTYMDSNDEYGTVIRVRIIDVKPQNETIPITESGTNAEGTTVPPTIANTNGATSSEESTTPARSVETIEEFDNEIPNKGDTLTA
ncbi:icarapin-like [Hylaeus anthracinus]|uniref:icarapin-like n=1 Tax=Hylaeus volcanicus TaxID=313075 RepID=UPI0023B879D3|nr:icarapin-like [Hylaeus volcanicus]XP_054004531.1 icarapin-like [Hylaeus anthracinus]